MQMVKNARASAHAALGEAYIVMAAHTISESNFRRKKPHGAKKGFDYPA
jgi:hypothetical protein